MKSFVIANSAILISGLKLRDDVGQSMAAIDSIVNHAIISEPPASSDTSDFVEAFGEVPAPSIPYQSEPAPAASCERNMEFVYNKFLETFPEHAYPSFLQGFKEVFDFSFCFFFVITLFVEPRKLQKFDCI
jgi:hypothetical protein